MQRSSFVSPWPWLFAMVLCWLPLGCSAVPKGALTPLDPAQLAEATRLARPDAGDDPVAHAQAMADSELALGRPDSAALWMQTMLARAQMAVWMARVDGDEAALHDAKTSRDRVARDALRWARRHDHPAVVVAAVGSMSKPKPHRRALRRALPRVVFPPRVPLDLPQLAELIGDHPRSRLTLARWAQRYDREAMAALAIDDPPDDPAFGPHLENRLSTALQDGAALGELVEHANRVLRADPWSVQAQLVMLTQREVEASRLRPDALLARDVTSGHGRWVHAAAIAARLQLRRANGPSDALDLGLVHCWWQGGAIGDAYHRLQTMDPPSDPGARALYEQLRAMVSVEVGDTAALERWHDDNEVDSATLDEWLARYEDPQFPAATPLGQQARRRIATRGEISTAHEANWLTAFEQPGSSKLRTAAIDATTWLYDTPRAWMDVCRERGLDGRRCQQLAYVEVELLERMDIVGRSRHFHPRMVEDTGGASSKQLRLLESLLEPYRHTVAAAHQATQDTWLRMDLAAGRYAAARTRLSDFGDLLSPQLRATAWLALDDLEAGAYTYDDFRRYFLPLRLKVEGDPTEPPGPDEGPQIERYYLATTASANGHHRVALDRLLPMLDELPDEAFVVGLAQAAWSAHRLGDAKTRDDLRHRLRAVAPHSAEFARLEATLLFEAGDPARARERLAHGLRWNPDHYPMREALVGSWPDTPAVPSGPALDFITTHASPYGFDEELLASGEPFSLDDYRTLNTAYVEGGEKAWDVEPRWHAALPRLGAAAIAWADEQVTAATTYDDAARWAKRGLAATDAMGGPPTAAARDSALWFSVLAGRPDVGATIIERADPSGEYGPMDPYGWAPPLVAAQLAGEIDDDLAWDLWRWLKDSDQGAINRVEALLNSPPSGTHLQVLACVERMGYDEQEHAKSVCLDAWRDHPRHPALATSRLYWAMEEPTEPENVAAVAEAIREPLLLATFDTDRDLPVRDEAAAAFHQNRGVWLQAHGDPQAATEAWLQAYALGKTDAAGFVIEPAQHRLRGAHLRLLYEGSDDETNRRIHQVRLARLALLAPAPQIAIAYARAAALHVPEDMPSMAGDDVELPHRIEHMARWAADDLAAGHLDPEVVSDLCDALLQRDFPTADRIAKAHPKSALAMLALSRSARSLDDLERARKAAEPLKKRYPDDPMTAAAIVPLLVEADQLDDARALYRRSLAAHPDDLVLAFIDAPESVTGALPQVPAWVRTPKAFDRTLAAVDRATIDRLDPKRYTGQEKAAELFAPTSWNASEKSELRFERQGARVLVLTAARAARCQGRACAQPSIDELNGGGRTLQWTRETTLAGMPATQSLFVAADETLVTWVMPTGGRIYTLVFAAPHDRMDEFAATARIVRDTFFPLDGVVPGQAAEGLRVAGKALDDEMRLHARLWATPGDTPCPIDSVLATLPSDDARAELLLDQWLATPDPKARARLVECAQPHPPLASRIAAVALLDESPAIHRFGRKAVAAHPEQVAADLPTLLGNATARPIAAPDYLIAEDLPGHGLIDVLTNLPEEPAQRILLDRLRSRDPSERALAWAAARLRPSLATAEAIELTLGGDDHRLAVEAAFLLEERRAPGDLDALRRFVDGVSAPENPDATPPIVAAATALAMAVDPQDEARLRDLPAKIGLPADASDRDKRANRVLRERLRDLARDHERARQLAGAEQTAGRKDDRALWWLRRDAQRQQPLRPAEHLRSQPLPALLPGSDWTYAQLAAPSLFASTVADVAGRLTTGDEATDERLRSISTELLRNRGFATLASSGGLDTSRPVECATPAVGHGWVCTARVTDHDAALTVFGQRDWGEDSGVHLPLSMSTTAGVVPLALTLLPAVLHLVVYPDEDEDSEAESEDDDAPPSHRDPYPSAAERTRMQIARGRLRLEQFSTIKIDDQQISIDSERYLVVGDRLWVFATDSMMETVMRTSDGPTLADDPEFARLTAKWKGGSALQAVAVGRAWPVDKGSGSMEVALDESGLDFRYVGGIEASDELVDIGPAVALLPPGAVSVFAHGLGHLDEIRGGDDFEMKATGSDADRVPPLPVLTASRGTAFGWYMQPGDRLWRRWLAVAPLSKPLTAALRKAKTPAGRGRSRRHGGLCYREHRGYLLVGDCALVDESVALPPPPPQSGDTLRLGHGTLDAGALAERLPELGGLTMQQQMTMRMAAPVLNVVTDLELSVDWTSEQRLAVVAGHVGFALTKAGDHNRVIDDWLAASETQNAATLPRTIRTDELGAPLRYEVSVPNAETFANTTLAPSPRITTEILGPQRVAVTVRPVPKAPAPTPLTAKERKDYTAATESTPASDKTIVALARSIAPADGTVADKATAISTWVHERLTYEVTPRSLSGTQILEAQRGDCTEYSTLTVTLLRALDIPAELRSGMAASGDDMVAHAWVAYHDGTTWHELDPTWGRDTVTSGHLEMSVLDALALISLGKFTIETIEAAP